MTDQLTEQPTEAESRLLDRFPDVERIERKYRLLHLQHLQAQVAHALMLSERAWRVMQEATQHLTACQERLHDALREMQQKGT